MKKQFTFYPSLFTMRYPFTVIHEQWLIVDGKCRLNSKWLIVDGTGGAG